MQIRDVEIADHVAINQIYNHYIINSIATFEIDVIGDEDMLNRVKTISSQFPYLVAEMDGELVGYAYANSWKTRSAYLATVESSIYISPNHLGKGYGLPLYEALMDKLQEQKIHVAIGGISVPNEVSVNLHLKCGFELVGTFKEVGYKFDKWIDVVYYQRTFLDN